MSVCVDTVMCKWVCVGRDWVVQKERCVCVWRKRWGMEEVTGFCVACVEKG